MLPPAELVLDSMEADTEELLGTTLAATRAVVTGVTVGKDEGGVGAATTTAAAVALGTIANGEVVAVVAAVVITTAEMEEAVVLLPGGATTAVAAMAIADVVVTAVEVGVAEQLPAAGVLLHCAAVPMMSCFRLLSILGITAAAPKWQLFASTLHCSD